jgi:hypothetical protein
VETVRKDCADCGIVATLTIVLHTNISTRVVREIPRNITHPFISGLDFYTCTYPGLLSLISIKSAYQVYRYQRF